MTTKELSTTEPQSVGFAATENNIQLLKTTLTSAGTNLTDSELSLFLYQAKQTGLDPLAKQIYVMKSGGKLTFMTSIDGQRLVAQRTGQYQGQVGPQWCGKDGEWKDVWLADEHPAAAKVGVYRDGFKEPVYGVATWKSYAKENSQTWKQLGDVMLAKCAEALAIRKAFPQELSGIYTAEEMEQSPSPTIVQGEIVVDSPISNLSKQKIRAALVEAGFKGTAATGFVQATINKDAPTTEADGQTLIVALAQLPTETEVAEAFEEAK